jgi:proton-coupled amino acid transporter
MRAPSHFGRVLVSGFAVVTVVYIVTGQLGYMCFGDNSRGSVTLNLPTGGSHAWLYSVVKLLLIFVIFCTYLIQFYVPLTYLEPPIQNYFNRSYVSYIFRSLIVLITSKPLACTPSVTLLPKCVSVDQLHWPLQSLIWETSSLLWGPLEGVPFYSYFQLWHIS